MSTNNSAWVVVSGRTVVWERTPNSRAFFSFMPTYTWEAGSSPTRTKANPGWMP